jgi:hypothetical protein
MHFNSTKKYDQLHRRYREKVLLNDVIVDSMWNKPCSAYNIHILLDSDTVNELSAIQDALSSAEIDSLIRCPIESLHISVLWILHVGTEYGCSKTSIWEEIRDTCLFRFKQICATAPRFQVRYTSIIVTDAAVIAVAEDDGQMNHLRSRLLEALPIPAMTRNNFDIIHTTLFRYRGPLQNPKAFLQLTESINCRDAVAVDELAIRKELIYPSLRSEIICTQRLGPTTT